MKQYRLYHPVNFDITTFAREFGEKDYQKALWFLNAIIRSCSHKIKINEEIYIPDQNKILEEEWTHINSKYINMYLTTNKSKQIIQKLIDLEHIEKRNGRVRVQYSFPIEYRIKERYIGGSILCTDKTILKKRKKELLFWKRYNKQNKANDLCKWLVSSLEGFSINYDAIPKDVIGEFIAINKSNKDNRDVHINNAKFINTDNSIEDILNNNFSNSKFSSKVGRFFSPMTNLNKKLRHYLYSVEKPKSKLYEIDISNCQPLLVGILYYLYGKDINSVFNKDYSIDTSFFSRLDKNLNTYTYGKEEEGKEGEGSYMCSNSQERKKEIAYYLDVCTKGALYEVLMQEMGIDPTNIEERDKVKKDMMKFILTGNTSKAKEQEPITLAFKKLFPTIWDFLCLIKENNYKKASRLLQSFESHIMFNHVVKNYIDAYKVGKIITIHDAIICTTEEKNRIVEIINNVFLNNYNIAVNIKVKQLGG